MRFLVYVYLRVVPRRGLEISLSSFPAGGKASFATYIVDYPVTSSIYWRKDVVELDRFIFFIGHLDY